MRRLFVDFVIKGDGFLSIVIVFQLAVKNVDGPPREGIALLELRLGTPKLLLICC